MDAILPRHVEKSEDSALGCKRENVEKFAAIGLYSDVE